MKGGRGDFIPLSEIPCSPLCQRGQEEMTVTLDSGWSLPSNVFIEGRNDINAGSIQFCKGLSLLCSKYFLLKIEKSFNREIADLSPHNVLIHVFVKYVLKKYKITLTLIIRRGSKRFLTCVRNDISLCWCTPLFVISKEQRD